MDAEPVRQHLRVLSAAGIGWERVAHLSGIAPSTVNGLVFARGVKMSRPARRCRRRTAEAILAVRPVLDNVADGVHVDATGSQRRLRALVANGHSMLWLGERLPMHPESARMLIRNRAKVTAAVARAVRDLYDELYDVHPIGRDAKRARTLAAKFGWAPPGAWDDDTIDDPAAVPVLDAEPDPSYVDEEKVTRAIRGFRVPRLTDAEVVSAVNRLMAAGTNFTRACDRLSVNRDRAKKALEKAEQPEAVAA